MRTWLFGMALWLAAAGPAGADLFFPHIATRGDWDTEVGVVNTHPENRLTGILRPYGADGSDVSTPLPVDLAPGGRMSVAASASFPDASDIAYLILEAGDSCAKGYARFFIPGRYAEAIPAVSRTGSGAFHLPHIASGGQYWTGVALLNTSDAPRELVLRFDTGDTRTISLAAGERTKFTIRSLFDGMARPDIGSATIEGASGVIGLYLFGSTEESGNSYLAGDILSETTATTLLFPHITTGAVYWTGIVVYNPGEAPTDLTVESFASDGTALGEIPVTLDAREKYAGTATGLGLPADAAWLRVRATRPIMGLELFATHDGRRMAGFSAVPISGRECVLSRRESDGWTGLALVNPGDAPASVMLRAVDDDGTTVASLPLVLGPGEKRVGVDTDFFTVGAAAAATHFRVSADRPVSAFVLGGSPDDWSMDGLPVQDATPPAAEPARTEYRVLASNDLGMHCVDREFSVFSILPPFNIVHAQVVGRDASGHPRLLTDAEVSTTYAAVADPSGSINSTSIGKTDFWQYAGALFGASLQTGEGLTGAFMPADHPLDPGPQPLEADASFSGFTAEGIPMVPIDDAFGSNPYPLLRIAARDAATGEQLARTDIVVPVSTETDCQNCHATGGIAASEAGIPWSGAGDREVQTKMNVLLLHDAENGTTLTGERPVLCARCHYSPALDLAGTGPQGSQVGLPTFSRTMHGFHGTLTHADGSPVFPPGAPVADSCYQCHPGQVTRCQRGAMAAGGMTCTACHGEMTAVGGLHPLQAGGSLDGTNDGGTRRPWTDLPRCQACHTGDAFDHLAGADLVFAADGIRLRQAYRTGDPSASPLLAANMRFAENPNTLYRNSEGHGGLRCEGCHGATHAVWPNADAGANDNIAPTQIQGHDGTVVECGTCHGPGSLPLTMAGPHGLHNVGDSRWNEEHEEFYEADADNCRACHGLNLEGTPLARMAATRTLETHEEGSIVLVRGTAVSCDLCHETPGIEGDDDGGDDGGGDDSDDGDDSEDDEDGEDDDS